MGIRGRLLLLIIGVATPLMIIGAAGLWNVWTATRARLDEQIERSAELAALAFGRWIEGQRQPLATTAVKIMEQPSPQSTLDESLRFNKATGAHWIDLHIYNADGSLALAEPQSAPPLDAELVAGLFATMRRRDSWAVETEWRGRRQPAFVIAVPFSQFARDSTQSNDARPVNPNADGFAGNASDTQSDGATGGAVFARVEAAAIEELFRDLRRANQAIITIYGPRGRLLYRSLTPGEFTGSEAKAETLRHALGDESAVAVELTSPFDNTERVNGIARAGQTDCIVTVGVPSETFYAPAYREIRRYALLSLAALVCAVGAAVLIAGGIARPINSLSEAARKLGTGEAGRRSPLIKGRSEVAALNDAFNRMAARVEEREQRLADLDRLKSEFVGGVSHELRTPLTTIKSLVRVLQRGRAGAAQQREYLATIAAECDRQIDLVLNLLDLSRIEAGAYTLAPSRVDTSEVLRACHRIERHAAAMRGHDFRLDLPDDLPCVLADHEALRRVVCSLIENSFKFTPDGGRVTLTAQADEDEVAISVGDTGYGIALDDLPHIFDKFRRGNTAKADDNGAAALDNMTDTFAGGRDADNGEKMGGATRANVPGVGLGLFLARTIIEQLGGRITVSSVVGEGSAFTVHLPLAPPDEDGDDLSFADDEGAWKNKREIRQEQKQGGI